jgi:hypothetical protein
LPIRIHRSLRRKTITQIEALRTRTKSPHHFHSLEKHVLYPQQAAEPDTQNNKQKTKENRRERASPIFISAAVSTGFPIQQQQRQSIQF